MLLGVLLASILLYGRATRVRLFPAGLGLIPREDTLVLVSGSLRALWEGVDEHFGEVIRDEETGEESTLVSLVAGLRETFDEGGVPVERLEDLARYGVDPERGVVLGLGRAEEAPGVTAVLPVADRGGFTSFVTGLLGSDPDEPLPASVADLDPKAGEGGTGPRLLSFDQGQPFVAFPEGEVAALTWGRAAAIRLRRGLSRRAENRAHALESDALYDDLRERLGIPGGPDPQVYLFWQPQGLLPFDEMGALLEIESDQILLDAGVRLSEGGLRVLDTLANAPPPAGAWDRQLPATTAAVLVLRDEAALDYLRLAARLGGLEEMFREEYGGVLGELQGLPALSRLLIAVTGYRDGLPELLLEIRGDPAGLEKLVDDLQLRHRKRRDRLILERALATHREERDGEEASSVEELFDSGYLAPEPDSLYDLYPIREGIALEAELLPKHLQVPSYRRSHGDHTMEYLLPPISDNDLRYDPELAAEGGPAKGTDRYRMATVLLDGVLWVATDAEDLEALLDRRDGEQGDDLRESPVYRTARTGWTAEDKIQSFLDVDQLTTLGLLSPESAIEEQVRTVLLDLRDHPAVALSLRADGRRRLSLHLRIVRRSGLVPG